MTARFGDPRAAVHAGAAWLLLAFMVDTGVGLDWDISWHLVVGRDTFWTPPHLLIYSGVFLGGLLSFAMVVLERRRAPLGFVLAGCGFLTLLAAAPFDDLWHRLYGVDVALWTPFHIMGLVGGTIVIVGMLYLFASETARRRGSGARSRAWELGTLFVFSGLLQHLMTVASPGTASDPTLDLGDLRVLLYPVLIAITAPLVLVAAAHAVPGRPSATITAAFLVVRTVVVGLAIPPADRWAAALVELPFRTKEPTFATGPFLMALAMLLAAVVYDRALHARPQGLRAIGTGLVAAACAAAYVVYVDRTLAPGSIPPEFFLPTPPRGLALVVSAVAALPLVVAGALLAGRIAAGWGTLLRLSPR